MGMGVSFRIALFLHLFVSTSILSLPPLMSCSRGGWPRCLAWHGWLLALSPRRVYPPWAVAMVELLILCWRMPWEHFSLILLELGEHSGILRTLLICLKMFLPIPTFGPMVAGMRIWMLWLVLLVLVLMFRLFLSVFDGRAWGHAQDLDVAHDASRIFPWSQVVCRLFRGRVLGCHPCPSSLHADSPGC